MPLLVKLVQAIAWPAVTLTAILIFRDEMKGLLDRLQSIRLKDYLLGFGTGAPDKEKTPVELEKLAPEVKPPKQTPLPLGKPATLFWLANDIMWVQDMLFRGAPSKAILSGLKNLRTYIKRLDLAGSLADTELARLVRIGEAALKDSPGEWSPEFRLQLARQVESVKWFLGSQAQHNEPGFKKLRVFPSRK